MVISCSPLVLRRKSCTIVQLNKYSYENLENDIMSAIHVFCVCPLNTSLVPIGSAESPDSSRFCRKVIAAYGIHYKKQNSSPLRACFEEIVLRFTVFSTKVLCHFYVLYVGHCSFLSLLDSGPWPT